MDQVRLVDTTEDLNALIAAIEAHPMVALDTEFVRERTFFPELCLLQLAGDGAIACIDCLANLKLDPLAATLGAAERTWILHSSHQDLEILLQTGFELPGKLIDTQLAAALLGMAPQIGYAQLVEDVLQVSLAKTHTRTDWRRRPLPPAALDYAVDDVRYLLPLWQRLEEMLTACGRLDWLMEDSRALLEDHRSPDQERRWQRVKGVRGLDREGQSVARELSAWRERQAARINRPRGWLLSDAALISLARERPASPDELARHHDLSGKFRSRHGSRLLKAITTGRARAPRHRSLDATPLSSTERREVKALALALRRRALKLGLKPEVVATREEITSLVRGAPTGRVARGWRARLLAELKR